jgi:GAF domain-containing protein
MHAIIRSVFDTSRTRTQIEKYRAIIIYVTTSLLVFLYSLYAAVVVRWPLPGETGEFTLFQVVAANPLSTAALVLLSLYLMASLGFAFSRQGMIHMAGWATVGTWYIGGVVFAAIATDSPGEAVGSIVLLVVLAGLLVGVDGIVAALVAGLITLGIRSLDAGQAYQTGEGTLSVFAVLALIAASGVLTYLFLHFAHVFRAQGAASALRDRQVTSEILSGIAHHVSRRAPLSELLTELVETINERFDQVYHTQVFLVEDSGTQARLAASTGQIGQQLITRDHRLTVGSQSVIGQVTAVGTPIIAQAGDQDTIHQRNELLTETTVEAAFPLRIGDRIIGALDVQSKNPDTFRDEDVMGTFQALADSITLAIDNVMQYERAEARVQENQRLVEQTREALREVERLNERLTGRAWTEYLRQTGQEAGFQIDFETQTSQAQTDWTASLREAIDSNLLVQTRHDDHQMIAVPLRVRGRVIGAMEFELDEDRNFSPEDFDLLQEVGERFGLAVENARLVDESQRVAQREALVNQITSRLQMSTDVHAMLNEAATSLRDALRAEKIAIRLGPPPAANGG